jgi:hypothetical protein
METHPYILETYRGKEVRKALVVEDALYCGSCNIRPNPVELPELE